MTFGCPVVAGERTSRACLTLYSGAPRLAHSNFLCGKAGRGHPKVQRVAVQAPPWGIVPGTRGPRGTRSNVEGGGEGEMRKGQEEARGRGMGEGWKREEGRRGEGGTRRKKENVGGNREGRTSGE